MALVRLLERVGGGGELSELESESELAGERGQRGGQVGRQVERQGGWQVRSESESQREWEIFSESFCVCKANFVRVLSLRSAACSALLSPARLQPSPARPASERTCRLA